MSDKTCGTCALKNSYYCDVTTWAVEDDDECSVPPEFGGASWKPKTCETCAHCVTAYNGDDSFCRATSQVIILRRFEVDGVLPYCIGVHYTRCADSVEQVALDMLDEIIERDERHPDEMPVPDEERRMYATRLNRLGVFCLR